MQDQAVLISFRSAALKVAVDFAWYVPLAYACPLVSYGVGMVHVVATFRVCAQSY